MDNMTLVLHSGLNNDTKAETFNLQRTDEAGLLNPVRFVKIVPISAHSPSFNTSIWHVSFLGVNDSVVVSRAEEAYASYKETTAIRHVLKYLRQRRHLASFRALQSRTGFMLEHPVVTKVHDNLMSGNWSTVESLLETAADEGLFDDCIQACDPKALWCRLNGANPDGDVPTARGGHQMCIDVADGIIYMFGGWDGKKSMDDLWAYSIAEGRWKLLSPNTALNDGPGPRSCHKMVFDPMLGYIYLLGCFDENERPRSPSPSGTATPAHPQNETATTPPTDTTANALSQDAVSVPSGAENGSKRGSMLSPLYRYTTRGPTAGSWTVLCADVQREGGPPLIYDHQMVIDSEKQMLYVFGGRIVDADSESGTMRFSGLYQYNIVTGQWEHILDESIPSPKISRPIPSRFGHSMVFDPRNSRLIILAGKKQDTFLADIYGFDVNTQEVTEMITDFSAAGGPDPSFCQRAALDPESGHIYVLPGLLKGKGEKKPATDAILRSTFWIFKPETLHWSQVSNARPRPVDMESSDMETALVPKPRYAHQMVYDHNRKVFYVHGGNSGLESNWRLDDFWSMTFERPTRKEMVRRTKFIARRQHFKELCDTVPSVQALTFLQRDVHAVVDHLSDEETATFRALQSHLFDKASPSQASPTDTSGEDIEMMTAGDASLDSSDSALKHSSRSYMPGIPELERDEQEVDTHPELTPELFRQRTFVFESLLELINADAKQPSTDLINLVVPAKEL
ncbi:hypothetical protein JB92DRAFT_2920225 [Gautieria morchelliformis]|nr:hypothetical protein JB92DRAFT_2920225 [Gautieria morchelliformis]